MVMCCSKTGPIPHPGARNLAAVPLQKSSMEILRRKGEGGGCSKAKVLEKL